MESHCTKGVTDLNIRTRINIAIADYFERRRLYKLYASMKSVGRNVHICKNHCISALKNVELGDHVWIGDHFFAKAEGGVTIGSGTILSRNVEIWTSNHCYDADDLQSIPYDKRMVTKPVVIGENVWIGTHVIILPGVTIGEGAVIGAGAVVAKDIPPYAVAGGNPAKVLKYRNIEKYEELKAQGKIYLDVEYDYDRSSLRKSEYWRKNG